MSYGSENKPLFGSSSSANSSSNHPINSSFPGQQAVRTVQNVGGQPPANLQTQTISRPCCDCFGRCSTNSIRRLLGGLGGLSAIFIIMVGVMTGFGWVNNCPECGCKGSGTGTCDNSCCYCVWTDVILPCYTVFLGGILLLAELRLPFIHSRCKDSCGFMFSLTWRAMYLVFIGSFGFAMKCQNYQWVGYGAGIFTFLNVAFSCWIMNTHKGFLTLTGHEDFSETTERSEQIQQNTYTEDFHRGTAMKRPVVGGGGNGGGNGNGYAPPPTQNFNAPDPYAATTTTQSSNEIFPEANSDGNGFDANPFA